MVTIKKLFVGVFFLSLMSSAFSQETGLSFRFSKNTIKAAITAYPLFTETTSAEASWIYNDDKDTNIGGVGFFVNGTRAELSGRAGVKFYGAKVDKDNGAGFAFGGDGALKLNEMFSVFASLYLGPSYVSFNDVESYEDWRLGVNMFVLDNINLSLSYGKLTIETDRYDDQDIEDGLALGLKMSF
jgi:hypothetical protein